MFAFEVRLRGVVALLFVLTSSVTPALAEPRPPVVVIDLLHQLTDTGAGVLFSSELVPATLDAPDVAPGADVMTRVAAALAANQLVLRRVGPRSYVVSRAPVPPGGPAGGAAADPLPPRPLTLEEISVLASRDPSIADIAGEPIGFDRADVEKMPGAQADAMRVLHAAPGVATNLSARPYVRGGLLDDVLVEFDGIPLADPFHFRSFQSVISAFDTSTVGQADVFTGGFPVKFGTRSGSVLDLTPRSVESGYEVGVGASRLSYDLESVGRSATLPLEWLLSERISREHSVVQPLVGETGEPKFSDTVARVRWTASDSSAFTLGVLALDDQLIVASDFSDEHATGNSRDFESWLKWDWTPADALRARSSFSIANTERNNDANLDLAGIGNGSLHEHRFSTTLSLRTEWAYVSSAAMAWNFGSELGWERAQLMFLRQESFSPLIASSFDRPLDASVATGQSPRFRTGAVFASAHRRWRDIDAELGARVDAQSYDGYGSRAQLSPRINVRYEVGAGWRAYGSWGQFTQAQRVDEYRSEANRVTPDGASRATHLVTGIARESAMGLAWRIEAYQNHWSSISPYFDNILGVVSVTPELEPGRVLVAPSGAEADGFEVSAHRAFGHSLSAWATYTWARVTDDVGGRDVPRSWDQTHAANVGVAWAHRQTTAAATIGWHTGWPRTPLVYVPQTAVMPTAPATPAALLIGTRNSARWGGYFTADLRLSTAINLRHGELSFWADATNVTNRANDCCIDLDAKAASGSLEVVKEVWSPRMINFGVTWRLRRTP